MDKSGIANHTSINTDGVTKSTTSTITQSSVNKGIALSFVSLVLLSILPIISNARPTTLNALNFAFYLSIWQLICSIPWFFFEVYKHDSGIFSPSITQEKRNYTYRIMLITGSIFSLSTFLYILSFEKAGTVNAAVAIQAYPLFAIIVEAILLSQRKRWQELVLTGLLIVGLFHIATSGSWILSGISVWFILALAVPLLWSIAHVTLKETMRLSLITPSQITFFRVLISSILLGLLSISINGVDMVAQGLGNLEFQKYAFMMGLFYYLELVNWFYAVKLVNVSIASSITTPTPILTMILAIFILGEQVTFYQLFGMAIVITSLYGLIYFSKRPKVDNGTVLRDN